MQKIIKTNRVFGALFLFCVSALVSLFFGCPASASGTPSTLSLSINTNSLLVDLLPTEDGTFGTSNNATISVSTNNYTGYTLKIASTNGTDLENSTAGISDVISSLSSSVSTSNFSSSSTYNNKWGYKPSQYITTSGGANTTVINSDTYLPSPTSTGDLLDITDSANSTAKTYTVNVGARADTTLAAGMYTNSFVIYAVSNTITYNIHYNNNTEDTVTNMPSPNPQVVDIVGGTPAAQSIATLSNSSPSRTGFTFAGWCDETTTEDPTTHTQTCSGNTIAAGGQLDLDQTVNPDIDLYAIWTINTYTVTLNKCSATNTPTGSTTATYYSTTLASIATLPTKSNFTASGFTTPAGNNASGATVSSTSPVSFTNTFNGWHTGSCASLGATVASSASTPALQASVSGFTDSSSRWTKTSAATLYAGFTTQSKNLPTITKTGGFTCGWTTSSTGATDFTYASGASITPSANTTLYGVCKCPANTICYDINATSGAEGTMGGQTITSSDTSATLLASNYSRSNYGYAGWSTNSAGTGTNYGPQQDITFTAGQYSTTGLTLYAKWIASAGNIQNWNGCDSLASGAVTALTDQRDNQTYAVAKLTDGKCWMIENLRLESTNSDNSTGALAQGYGTSSTYGNFSGLATAETANFTNSTTANSLYYSGTQSGTASVNIGTTNYPGYRMPRYRNDNISSRASSPTNSTGAMYSYGNYYTWPAAVADTAYYNTSNQSITTTSLCPAGWRLPRGGNKSNESNNDFWSLVVDGINNGTNPANYDSSTAPYYIPATEADPINNALRAYPNNFVYSGYANSGNISTRGSGSRYWSSTVSDDGSGSYYLYFGGSNVRPGTGNNLKNNGFTLRCMFNSADTITLDKNGATNTPTASTTVKIGDTTLGTLTTLPTKSGYTISGFTTPAGNNASGATVSSTTSLTANNTFNGWHASSGTGTLVASSASTPVLQANVSGYTDANGKWNRGSNATLYAGWTTQSKTLPTITKTGYTCGWTTTSTGATDFIYASGASITPSANTTLYGVCKCPANTICYDSNASDAVGTMGGQTITSSDTSATLLASNYSRSNYGYAGWNTNSAGTGTNYGPQQDITFTAGQYSTTGLILYAKWIASAGNIQNWNGCSSLASGGAVTALKDQRDNQVYAVAKLADGNCWMIENLRLESTNSDNSTGALAQGYNSSFIGLANSEAVSLFATNSTTANNLYSTSNITGSNQGYRFPRYNNTNTSSRASSPTDSTGNIYSYGNYYTWSAAIADTSNYTIKNDSVNTTSICPAGWKLPVSGQSTVNPDGDYYVLAKALAGGVEPNNLNDGYSYYEGVVGNIDYGTLVSTPLKSYPNNFVYGGRISSGGINGRGSNANYWTSTINGSGTSFSMRFENGTVGPGTTTTYKYYGLTARCLVGKTINDLTYMQDFATLSDDAKTEVINSMVEGEQYQLIDDRDQKPYYISKMKDGRVWMTQNLDLDLETTPTNVTPLTHANTDLGWTTLDTTATWTPSTATATTAADYGTNTNTAPASFDYGDTYRYVDTTGTTTSYTSKSACETAHNDGTCPHYHVGNYYNWSAAVASNNTSSITTNYTTAPNSICPAGWRLPEGRTSTTSTDPGYYSEINYTWVNEGLAQDYVTGTGTATYNPDNSTGWINIRNNPMYMVAAGYKNGTSAPTQLGTYGRYWTSTVYSSSVAYAPYFYSSGLYPAYYNSSNSPRGRGFSIRCVVRQANTGSTVISFNKNADNATGTTGTNNTQSIPASTFANLASNGFTRTGYVFNSWNTKPDGSGTSYQDTSQYYAKVGPDTKNVTLYAQWSEVHTITFNVSTNATGIYFDGTTYTNGQTAEAIEGKEYQLSGVFPTKYGINSWSATTGTIANTSTPTTTYTVAGDATITITGKEATTNISSLTTPTSPVSSNCKNEAVVPQLVYDPRDNEAYYVARLCDGNIWMLDNLRLDLANSTVINNLSSTNTNATNTQLNYLKNGGGTTSDQYPTAGLSGSNVISDFSQYSIPQVNNTYKNDIAPLIFGLGSGKVGVYYNYCATSAGTYCWGNGTNSTGSPSSDPNTSSFRDIEGDICPAGWHLPNYTGEYNTLYSAYSGGGTLGGQTTLTQDIASNTALSTPMSGNYQTNSQLNLGSTGLFWSSTWTAASYMRNRFVNDTTGGGTGSYFRYIGLSIRCILGSV